MTRDRDDPWKDVVDEVERAFADLGLDVKASELRDALREGLEKAWADLPERSSEAEPPRTPEVTVLEGGAGDTVDAGGPEDDRAPPSRAAHPHLQVARGDADGREAPPGDETEPSDGEVPRTVRVRSVRWLDDLSGSAGAGRIRLGPGEDAWQTVFRGGEPRTYRIGCTHGTLDVAIDGVLVDRIGAGQSLDVEARLIRVHAAGDDPATGNYARVGQTS